MTNWSRLKIFFVLSILFSNLCLAAYGSESDLERLQSLYIQKIIHYVEWPANGSDRFTIAIYDNEKLFTALTETFNEKVINGKTVHVVKADKSLKIGNVHIVCAQQSEKFKLLPAQGVLYITTDTSGLQGKSILNFFEEEGKLRFDINQSKASESNLRINSRLLKLARTLK